MKLALAENKILKIGNDFIDLPSHIMPALPEFWVRADSGITKDGSNKVSQWNDLSANSKHLTQVTASLQPTWIDNVLNGKPVVRFNSSKLRNANVVINQPYTIFIVYSMTAASTVGFIINMVMGAASNGLRYYLNSFRYNAGADIAVIAQSLPVPHTLFSGILNGANSKMFFNGNFHLTNNFGTNGSICITLGSWDGSPPYYLFGDIAELIIFNGELNDSQRQVVESYLMTKYEL